MKNASSGLKNLLATSRTLIFADLWSFTLKNGLSVHYTSWDQDLFVAGTTYKSHDVTISGGKLKQIRGLEVNETDLVCYPSMGLTWAASVIGNVPFLIAVRSGMMDRATVTRQRVFMPTPGDTSLGAVSLFLGEVTDTDVTRNMATLKCKDATNLLNIYMPRRQYQPTCSWTFGDSNCTVNKAAITVASTVAAGSGGNIILAALTQASGYFNYGTVTFTSGVNAGISRAVKTYTKGQITLTGPFPLAPSTGDTFTICPGCSKNLNGVTQSFNGAAATGISPSLIPNSAGNPAGAFNGYTLTFTSGALAGSSSVISSWQPNYAVVQTPFNQAPSLGDQFEITPPGSTTLVAFAAVTQPLSASEIPIELTMADGFFNNGTLEFTSGLNVGQTQTIVSWQSGIAIVVGAFTSVPLVGDECVLTTATSNTQATCTGYNNTINFGGTDTIPIPETAW